MIDFFAGLAALSAVYFIGPAVIRASIDAGERWSDLLKEIRSGR